MLDALALLTIVSALLAVVLAAARDVPILDVLRLPRSRAGAWTPVALAVLCLPLLAAEWGAGATLFGVRPLAIAWPIMLAYFWWCVGWNVWRGAAILLAAALAFWPRSALAFNALGHKVIADIAWQELDEAKRHEIVAILRRHPRFDDDFAQRRDETVTDEDRWIFQHAATWPDQIRGNRDYDKPTWHYVNFPLFVGGELPVTFNRSLELEGDREKYNIAQAIAHCRKTLDGDAQPSEKALAYCWLFHLVGDLHQPMHSVALVCDRFPGGDRGGNSIPLVQGDNLHALWDNFLGRQHRMADVEREIVELRRNRDAWKVDTTPDVPAWIAESRELAESSAYGPEILAAVQQPGELAPINLPRNYLTEGGRKARLCVTAAGLRLASLLAAKPISDATER